MYQKHVHSGNIKSILDKFSFFKTRLITDHKSTVQENELEVKHESEPEKAQVGSDEAKAGIIGAESIEKVLKSAIKTSKSLSASKRNNAMRKQCSICLRIISCPGSLRRHVATVHDASRVSCDLLSIHWIYQWFRHHVAINIDIVEYSDENFIP